MGNIYTVGPNEALVVSGNSIQFVYCIFIIVTKSDLYYNRTAEEFIHQITKKELFYERFWTKYWNNAKSE